jgi:tetratricopeptide (TPR) repeat protein
MRHAVVVAPQHFELPVEGPASTAPDPIGPLCASLESGGNAVALIATDSNLQRTFERAIEGVGSGDDLLVFVAASTKAEGDTVVLGVDDASGGSLPLRAISDAVRARNPYAVAFVIETADDRPSDGDGPGADLRPLATALDAKARGYTLLVGWRPSASVAEGTWPFTRRLVDALDDPRARDERDAVPLSRIFERLVVAGANGSETSVACERAWLDFVLLEPSDVVQVAAVLRASEPAPRLPGSAPPAPAPAKEQAPELPPPPLPPSDVAAPAPASPVAEGETHAGDGAASLPSFPFPDEGLPPPAVAAGRAERDPFPSVSPRPLTPLPPPRMPTPPPPATTASTAAAPATTSSPPAVAPPPIAVAPSASPPAPASPGPTAGAPAGDLPSFALPDEIDELLAAGSEPPAASASARPPPASPLPPPPARGASAAPPARAVTTPARAVPTPAPPAAAEAPAAATSLPPPRPPEPSLPPLDALVDLADGARARGALREALAAYKGALALTPEGDASRRAALHARIGEVRVALGKVEEAEAQFEKALQHDPNHRPALDGLVALAIENKEPRRVIERRRRRLRAHDRNDERVVELRAIARVFLDDLGDVSAAAAALEEARAVDARHRAVSDDLRAAYERLERWPQVVQLLSDLADALEGGPVAEAPRERAAVRFSAADVALASLRDEPRAMALLDRGLDEDPANDRALHTLASLHAARKDWEGLDAAYARMIARLARIGDVERAWGLCRTLAGLRRGERNDVPGAIEALSAAVSCKPGDVESRALLAELLVSQGELAAAMPHYEELALLVPADAGVHARIFDLSQQAGEADRAWLAGCVLEELGAADMDQQLVVDQYRTSGPIRPLRSLNDAAWDELLRAPGSDAVAASIFAAIAAAAAAARVDELRDARKLVSLDPERRQGASSTASAVRSFHWAAHVLGVEAPQIYAMDDVPGGVAAVAAAAPSTVLGPGVLRGVSTKELAFLAGRHLTYYRPEHYALVHYPTLSELSVLFLAAVKLALPDLAVPDAMGAAVTRTRKALSRRLDDGDKRRLQAAVERLQAREGRVDLAVWIRSVELSAHRAGLLLCGDLATAMSRVRAEIRAIGELGLDEKRADLLAYGDSRKHAAARAMLGVDARASVAPPAPAEAVESEGKAAALGPAA